MTRGHQTCSLEVTVLMVWPQTRQEPSGDPRSQDMLVRGHCIDGEASVEAGAPSPLWRPPYYTYYHLACTPAQTAKIIRQLRSRLVNLSYN